jgi:predicted RNA binding protein YcfA (HicA-like mRNA interferase family)
VLVEELAPEVHEVSNPRKPGLGPLRGKAGGNLAPGTLNSVLRQAGLKK